jgi:glycosyltransferase involved in cell wall biosynthesis
VVRFVGTIPEKQLPSFYRSGDVYCYLGSPYCGGGSTASLSVVEAQACGIPVLRSLGGDGEIVDQKTGYYIHDYSEKGVARAIMRFLCLSQSKKRALSREARQHSIKEYSWNKTTNALVRAINTLSYA